MFPPPSLIPTLSPPEGREGKSKRSSSSSSSSIVVVELSRRQGSRARVCICWGFAAAAAAAARRSCSSFSSRSDSCFCSCPASAAPSRPGGSGLGQATGRHPLLHLLRQINSSPLIPSLEPGTLGRCRRPIRNFPESNNTVISRWTRQHTETPPSSCFT